MLACRFPLFLRGKSILSIVMLELCVPVNLPQVGSIHSLLQPLQRAQSASVSMATLPWERERKERGCCFVYEIVLLHGAALPAAWLNGLSLFSTPPSHFSVN